MYFLLTGVAPAPAPARASGDQKLLPPSQLVPSISTGAEMVVRKALSLPREQRWSSAAEMRQMVDETAQRLAAKPEAGRKAPPPTPSHSQPAPTRGQAQRWPLLLGLAVGIVAVVALAAVLLSRSGSELTAAATPLATAVAAANPTATLAAATPTIAPVTPTPAPATPTLAGEEATQEAPAGGQATPPPTSTSIPTRTPIPTPRPAAATVVRPAPTAPPAPAPASAAAAANVTVALLEPNDGDTREGEVAFRWSVTGGSLAAGQAFEVFFYRTGEDPLSGGFGLAAPTSGSSALVDLPGLDATAGYPLDPGSYLWGVRLVQGGRPVQVVAEGRRLVYQRPQQAQPVQPSQPAEPAPTALPTAIP
jgi:hypothetical protein